MIMTMQRLPFLHLACLLFWAFLLSGCEQLGLGNQQNTQLGKRPDLDCIIANDFYAVHFSTYLQPGKDEMQAESKAAFVPFCQKIPRAGKMFFTADLIDRDIRATPIAIRLVEVEKTTQKAPDDLREIRTLSEIPAKLYPRGAVEAQAEIDKNGDYALYLLIGDAEMEDDRFRISLEVGVDPNDNTPIWLIGIATAVTALLILGGLLYWFRFRKPKNTE